MQNSNKTRPSTLKNTGTLNITQNRGKGRWTQSHLGTSQTTYKSSYNDFEATNIRTRSQINSDSQINSSQSLNLGGRRGTTDDVAPIHFHPSLSSTVTGNLQTPFPTIPWCYLPISSSVFLSFLLSLSPAEVHSPYPRILRCGHTIWASVSLPWLGDHYALQLHSGFCCEPSRLSHGLCRKMFQTASNRKIASNRK